MATKRPVKRTAKAKRSPQPDFNQVAQRLVRMSTEGTGPGEVQTPSKSEISRVMAELGRRGGKVGGKRRAANMTEAQRSNAAAAAAKARWARPRSVN